MHMKELPIIVLAAPSCSGKSEVLTHLCKNHYVGVDMGVFIRKILQIDIVSRQSRVLKIKEQIEEYGRKKIMSQLLDHLFSMYQLNTMGFVICGMRHSIDMKILSELADNKVLNLFIYADSVQRYLWCKNRMRKGDPITFLDFIKIDYEEIYSGIYELLASFDFKLILNNAGLKNLFCEVDNILNNWNNQK